MDDGEIFRAGVLLRMCFKEFSGEVPGMLSCKEQEEKKTTTKNKNRMGRRGL